MRLLETVRPQLALRERLSDEGIHLRAHYTRTSLPPRKPLLPNNSKTSATARHPRSTRDPA